MFISNLARLQGQLYFSEVVSGSYITYLKY